MDINFDNIIEREKLNREYEKALKSSKILYISATIGYGKTISVLSWLNDKHKNYSYATVEDENFFECIDEESFIKKKYVVLDDISFLQDEEDKNRLLKYINDTEAKFILIGRNRLPSFLKPMLAMGQVSCFEQKSLCFDEKETQALFDLMELPVSEKDLRLIMEDTEQMPLGIMLMAKNIKNGKYTPQIYEAAKQDYFDCLDYAMYQQLTEPQRIFILNLVTVEQFDIELASILTGLRNIEQKMLEISDFDSIFKAAEDETYVFSHSIIQEYFQYKQKIKFSKETILQLYQKAGLYYELKGNIMKALEYYDKGENADKLSALLIENSKQDGASANFFETEKYYKALAEEQIRESPELMCGMSMLNSVCLRPEESEKWYSYLKEFAESTDKRDGRYKIGRDKLLYLDIGLPHRGSNDLKGIIQKISAVFITKRVSIQDMGVTGNMPSLMNGGKDFCKWSANDTILAKTLKKPIELVLGKSGIGLADGGLAESFFEKRQDLNFTESLSYLNKALSEVTNKGTVPMRFALLGIMSRIFVASGSVDSAVGLIESFRDTVQKDTEPVLIKNIDTWLVMLKLYAGDRDAAEEWMQKEAPDEFFVFYSSTRLQYQVKTRIYIMEGRFTEALSLIARLREYYENYDRPYGRIQSMILQAMIHYRMNEEIWEEELAEAVAACEEYKFYRIMADEGNAILEPLSKLKYDGDESFYKKIVHLTRLQAINYPMYLVKKDEIKEKLTEMERNVLKLITQGLSNEKVADILGITLRTVKYHTGNIYSKMGVKSRAEAIARVNGYLD